MHVDGAEGRPLSDRYLSDHVLPSRAPEIRDSQPLRRIQTGLGLVGSIEGTQAHGIHRRIRPKNAKSKLFQKRIDPNDPMERTSDLLRYAEQLQVIHKSIPTSPKDRLLLKWTDNPVMFDGRGPHSPPVPTREIILKKSKTMNTRVERIMELISSKIPSFEGIDSRTRVVKADPPQEVSEVPKSSSRSPLAERIAPIPLTPGTLSGDPLNIIMSMAAQERLRSLHGHDIIGHDKCSQKLQSLAAATFPLFRIEFARLLQFNGFADFVDEAIQMIKPEDNLEKFNALSYCLPHVILESSVSLEILPSNGMAHQLSSLPEEHLDL
ncbi:hypothetical protein PSTT_03999 [Puccinia striiformis]|uniref:Uncharacterized protein n=1 Tax=Puccinia striiformis TaxID=27350 RepID=A0A2S4VU27_9BASI|nr:hypothetical protein PSTT_03999 [Puccinia striiformis]